MTTSAAEDLLQANQVVKERWKVVGLNFFYLLIFKKKKLRNSDHINLRLFYLNFVCVTFSASTSRIYLRVNDWGVLQILVIYLLSSMTSCPYPEKPPNFILPLVC